MQEDVSASSDDRIPLHTREVSFRIFARRDRLWDVEGTLRDTKEAQLDRPSMPPLLPGDTVHSMHVRATVDDDLRIVAIEAVMHQAPFGECQMARAPVDKLVGRILGRGWRSVLNEVMGGVSGCTHLRELLANMPTAAIQGIAAFRDQRRARESGQALVPQTIPYYVDGCMSWRRDGPLVARLLPQFAVSTDGD